MKRKTKAARRRRTKATGESSPALDLLGALRTLLPLIDPNLPIPEIDRTVEPDGTITERITLKDRKTGRVISRQVRRYTADEKPISINEEWYDNNGNLERVFDEVYVDGKLVSRYEATVEDGVRKHGVAEEFEDGILKKKTVVDVNLNWYVLKRVVDEYEGGKLKKKTIKGLGDAVEATLEYSYDGSGRLLRIVEHDAAGNVTKVTVIDYRLDGSFSVTVTDYSYTPAKVTRSEYGPNGWPL